MCLVAVGRSMGSTVNAGANKRSTSPGTRPGNDRDGPSKLNRGNSSGRPVKANRNRRDPGRARRVTKDAIARRPAAGKSSSVP